ncbi:hypothetical protein [Streptomyces sp. NPDC026673]|uniref:hypothetical protein n=1 Tax=Streptomyces sp. NPDC026673 TaxID=3155724 RepID=UPI0033FC86CC
MLETVPTPKPGGMLNNAFVAVRRLQGTSGGSRTGRHRGRPAGERLSSVGVPGTGAHRRPPKAGNGLGSMAAED